jgi:hypothetical protein
MKNLILIFSLLIVFISKAQSKYSLANYPMKSDIWMGKMYEGSVYIGPKDGTSFDYNEDFLKKVDMKVVQSYLQQSFDEFRNCYGLSPVKLDVNLTKLCVVDAKNMNQFKPKFTNDDKSAKQFWDKIPVLCFSKVFIRKINTNKSDYSSSLEDVNF